jgi:formylglycine-generating enzyme required for sulfatase activity
MGCNTFVDKDCCPDEYGYHMVQVAAFMIDAIEVSVGQYHRCVQEGKCSPPDSNENCSWISMESKDLPVDCVDWYQAEEYCEWTEGRLCREAEWEKAARGGCSMYGGASCSADMPIYPWGNEEGNCFLAQMEDCPPAETVHVLSLPDGASAYGLLHMAGNVREWVYDCYHDSYLGAPTNGSAWETDCGVTKVARGGAYDEPWTELRTSSRRALSPDDRSPGNGIRCCRTP